MTSASPRYEHSRKRHSPVVKKHSAKQFEERNRTRADGDSYGEVAEGWAGRNLTFAGSV